MIVKIANTVCYFKIPAQLVKVTRPKRHAKYSSNRFGGSHGSSSSMCLSSAGIKIASAAVENEYKITHVQVPTEG